MPVVQRRRAASIDDGWFFQHHAHADRYSLGDRAVAGFDPSRRIARCQTAWATAGQCTKTARAGACVPGERSVICTPQWYEGRTYESLRDPAGAPQLLPALRAGCAPRATARASAPGPKRDESSAPLAVVPLVGVTGHRSSLAGRADSKSLRDFEFGQSGASSSESSGDRAGGGLRRGRQSMAIYHLSVKPISRARRVAPRPRRRRIARASWCTI